MAAIAIAGGHSSSAAAQKKPAPPAKMLPATAINKAGRQRMLSQRMAKAYAQLGLGILPDRAFKILNDSIAQFDAQHAELTTYAPSVEIAATYAQLGVAWRRYKDLLATSPSAEVGAQIQEQNVAVLALCQRGVTELEAQSGTKFAQLVNLAGRQRMLSQRAEVAIRGRRMGALVKDDQ